MTPAETELLDELDRLGRVEFDGRDREISAEFLGTQLLRGNGSRPRKLTLRDVTVVGELDVEAGEVGFPVEFERCTFDHAPNLEQAAMAGLYFSDCRLPGLRASQVRLQDGLALRGCTINGCVQLTGAHVSGQLDMDDCVIDGPRDGALKADGLRVDLDVYCSGRFAVNGLTHMIGAHFGGQFICDGSTFRNPGGDRALDLSGLTVDEHVFWCNGFTAEGDVFLRGATIAGRLICDGAHFSSPGRTALLAYGITVRQQAEFSTDCVVDGELNLVGGQFGAWLKFTGGRFSNPGGVALNLTRAVTALNLVLREGTNVRGELRLAGARIGGLLGAQGAHLDNEGGVALNCYGLRVSSDLSLSVRGDERFHAHGQVVLSDAHVGGDLDCTGGRFDSDDGEALTARGIDVVRDIKLCKPFVAHGKVDLAGASVEGKIDFTGAELEHSDDAVRCDRVRVGHAVIFDKVRASGRVRMCDARIGSELTFFKASLRGKKALKLRGTQVRGALRLKFAERPAGRIDLRQAQAGSFGDSETDWSAGSMLDGFVYGALREKSMELDKRLRWLRDSHPYVPQVYLQLAATYASAGQHDEATDVLMAKEDARRRTLSGFFGRLHRSVWWLLSPTVGYGYRPLRILWCLGALTLVGGFVFHLLRQDAGNFAIARPHLSVGWFDPWLYTVDLLLPIMSLEHSQLWVPLHGARWASLAFTVLGWVLAVCLVTGIGRLFKRDER
ncbi:hypothetical protein ACFWN2_17480 [Lentzea sp. NPDC058436]|uniref:hypothetical protein n=1 Tax=Lentzea sp. NPDC058436 TaxID=3346499 RepID=UPI003664D4CB